MSKKPMGRVLIVGGGGFIGRHVVKAFRDEGAAVAVMDSLPPAPDLDIDDWITGSITDPSLVASAAAGCRTVAFLANASLPNSSHADLAGEVDAHVRVTVRAAEICDKLRVKKFLFASSGGTVYGIEPEGGKGLTENTRTLPRNAYGASKLAIEHYLRLLGAMRDMNVISLRISNPYGQGQRATRGQGLVAAAMQHAIEGSPLPIWGDGSAERDFVHVSDVASAFTQAAKHDGPGRVVNIGSGQGVSIARMLDLVETATGRTIKRQFRPDRKIDVQRNVLDIGQARRRLGWSPKIDLEEGLAQTALWWQENHSKSL